MLPFETLCAYISSTIDPIIKFKNYNFKNK